jgi:hypothetical protein
LLFAGLWDAWRKPDGRILKSYTVITTEPNELLAPVHNRMPAILNDSDALEWLTGGEIGHALSLLKPFPAELLDGYEVSKLVNSPQHDFVECNHRYKDNNHDRIQWLLDFRHGNARPTIYGLLDTWRHSSVSMPKLFGSGVGAVQRRKL